jgi:hypothetical protein
LFATNFMMRHTSLGLFVKKIKSSFKEARGTAISQGVPTMRSKTGSAMPSSSFLSIARQLSRRTASLESSPKASETTKEGCFPGLVIRGAAGVKYNFRVLFACRQDEKTHRRPFSLDKLDIFQSNPFEAAPAKFYIPRILKERTRIRSIWIPV